VRLLGVLVALVGAALVVGGNPSLVGESAPPPAHVQSPSTQGRDPVDEPAAGTTGVGVAGSPRPSPPRTLVIRSLGIRATVVPLEASGTTLAPPDDTEKVGWWRDGAMPGAAHGSAVVTGHTVLDGDGVFDELARLRSGDRVLVLTGKGALRYVVRAEATYRRKALAHRAPRLFSRSGPGRLVLVTCEDWNGEVYLANRVVIATPA